MTRKPPNFQWIGFSGEQITLLDRLDFYGNNGWSRTSQLDHMMPVLLLECERLGLTLERTMQALGNISYDARTLHQLARWESKRRTGSFGV